MRGNHGEHGFSVVSWAGRGRPCPGCRPGPGRPPLPRRRTSSGWMPSASARRVPYSSSARRQRAAPAGRTGEGRGTADCIAAGRWLAFSDASERGSDEDALWPLVISIRKLTYPGFWSGFAICDSGFFKIDIPARKVCNSAADLCISGSAATTPRGFQPVPSPPPGAAASRPPPDAPAVPKDKRNKGKQKKQKLTKENKGNKTKAFGGPGDFVEDDAD